MVKNGARIDYHKNICKFNISPIHWIPVDRNEFSSIQKKLCLASYYIQLYTNIKMYNHEIKTNLYPCRKLLIIRCKNRGTKKERECLIEPIG